MEDEKGKDGREANGWKRRLGLGLLVYSFVPICTVQFVAFLPLSAGQAVTFGAVYIGSGELACLAAVALLGKPFIEGVKRRIKGFFLGGRETATPRHIGKARHYTGIAMLMASFVPYYIVLGLFIFSPPKPSGLRGLLFLLLAGEGLFWAGLLLLGGEFWARLKKLFEWPGRESAGDVAAVAAPGPPPPNL